MRILFLCGMVLAGALLMGCNADHSTDAFYERHPEYEQKPSYFDKTTNYDDQDLNERYSGNKN